MTRCEICGTKDELFLCKYCIENLQEMLDRVPEISEELQTRVSAPVQSKYKMRLGDNPGGKNSASPVDIELSEATKEILVLPAWAETIAKSSEAREDTVAALSAIDRAQLLTEDEPDIRVWGQCSTPDCDHVIRAPVSHRRTRCSNCGWPKDLSEVMGYRLRVLDLVPTPPRQTRQALQEMTSIRVTKKTFENWVYHGRLRYVLDSVGFGQERRLYFVRDLLFAHQSLSVVP